MHLFNVLLEHGLAAPTARAHFRCNEPFKHGEFQVSAEIAANAKLLAIDRASVTLAHPVAHLLLEAGPFRLVTVLDAICQLEDEAAQVGQEPAALNCVPVESLDQDLALCIFSQVVVTSMEITMKQAESLLCLRDVRRCQRFLLNTAMNRIPGVKLACDFRVVLCELFSSFVEPCEPAALCHDRILIVEPTLNVKFRSRGELSHTKLDRVGSVHTLPNIGARRHVIANVVDKRHQPFLFFI